MVSATRAIPFHEQLELAMVQTGVTPTHLSVESDIHLTRINNYRSGKSMPHAATIFTLAEILDRTPVAFWDVDKSSWFTKDFPKYFEEPPGPEVYSVVLRRNLIDYDLTVSEFARNVVVGKDNPDGDAKLIKGYLDQIVMPSIDSTERIFSHFGLVPFYFTQKGSAPQKPMNSYVDGFPIFQAPRI